MDKLQEAFNKDLEELKNKQRQTAITEIENTLEAIKDRITEAEEPITELEDTTVWIMAEEQEKEKRM